MRLTLHLDDKDLRRIVGRALREAGWDLNDEQIVWRDKNDSVIDGGIRIEVVHTNPAQVVKFGPYR